MMRRILLFASLVCLSLALSGQTQQGYVKTKGRMVNGKHVAGKGLPGATVNIQGGNSVGVKNANGSFSFVIPAKTYMVQSVQKKGYELVDADAVRKPYQHSANPLYLVMETPEQQMEDLLEAQEQISKTLREQLMKSRQEIQQLKDENIITEEDYRRQIAKLMENQHNSQKLIADMAKEYSQMDYDQMDSLNQRISDAILNGRLMEADSLLRSKGDMKGRIEEVRKEQQAEAQEELELAQRLENLEVSKEGTKKKLEDIASDCYKFFDRFKLENLHDSAAYYIELRAELDTTNAEWQFDAAYYLQEQNQFGNSAIYYERALDIRRRLAHSNPLAYEHHIAQTLNNLANLYSDTQRFMESESMYKEALEIRRHLAYSNPQTYESYVALTLNNLAILYSDTYRLTESEAKYKEALEIYRRLAHSNPQAYEHYVAQTLNNLANLYSDTQRFAESESMYREALEIYRRLVHSNPQAYEPYVAHTLNNLASLYSDIQCLTESEAMYKEALETYRRLAHSNWQAYASDVAMALNNLASLYKNTQRFTESEAMYKKALEIRHHLARSNPQAYDPDVSHTLNNLAILYYSILRYTESEVMYKEALKIRRSLAKANPQAYESSVADTQYNMGLLKIEMDQYDEAIPSFEEALSIYRRIGKDNPVKTQGYEDTLYNLSRLYSRVKNYLASYLLNKEWLPIMKKKYEADPESLRNDYAGTLGGQSFYCIFSKQYEEAEQYAREGLAIDSTQQWIATNLAAALLFQGKYDEAEQIYRQYKDELKNGFLGDFKQFAEAGIIPKEREKDVERIKKILEE